MFTPINVNGASYKCVWKRTVHNGTFQWKPTVEDYQPPQQSKNVAKKPRGRPPKQVKSEPLQVNSFRPITNVNSTKDLSSTQSPHPQHVSDSELTKIKKSRKKRVKCRMTRIRTEEADVHTSKKLTARFQKQLQEHVEEAKTKDTSFESHMSTNAKSKRIAKSASRIVKLSYSRSKGKGRPARRPSPSEPSPQDSAYNSRVSTPESAVLANESSAASALITPIRFSKKLDPTGSPQSSNAHDLSTSDVGDGPLVPNTPSTASTVETSRSDAT